MTAPLLSGPMSPQRAAAPASAAAPAAAPAEASWRPAPTCPKAHQLERKTVAGSWFAASKACQACGVKLGAGAVRYSCKVCGHHLCESCAAARSVEMLEEEIAVTVYRAAQQGLLPGLGVEEDTWQVRVRRNATASALKAALHALYDLPMMLMEIRRDADSAPMGDAEMLRCDEGDVLYLTSGGPFGGLVPGLVGGSLGAPLGGLAEALQGAAAEAAEAFSGAMAEANLRAEELARTEYSLNVVWPEGQGTRTERRCRITVMATARVAEVLEMAKLELNAEEEAVALEFAGERLPPAAAVHALGLCNGDTVLVVAAGGAAGRLAL